MLNGTTLVRVPRRFYDDHEWRDLPVPPAIRRTAHHVWIELDHPDMGELVNDAEYYADKRGGPPVEDKHSRNLRNSAQKTVDSVRLAKAERDA